MTKITDKLLKELKDVIGSATYQNIESDYQEDLNVMDCINKGLRIINYKNLPQGIDNRILNIMLFFRGKLVFFKDEMLGYFALPFARTDEVNAYGVQTKLRPIAVGTQADLLNNKVLTIDEDCVIMRLNDLEIPPLNYAIYYGKKISETIDMIENNNQWLKLPLIFQTTSDKDLDKKHALVIKDVIGEKGVKLPIITDAFNQLKTIEVKPQYLGAELQELKKNWKNDYYEYLGINHHEDKKERLTDDEVERNNEESNINTAKIFEPLQNSIDKINKMFGLDIEIEINKDFRATEQQKTTQTISSLGGN